MNKKFYKSLYRIRRVEEEIAKVYPTDKIQSPVHLSIGQESVSVGICEALRSDDIAFGTYRGHALYLAKGGDLKSLILELFGKANGCSRGKGGSMHLISEAVGLMGTSAVVGSTIPHAVGYAYAIKLRSLTRTLSRGEREKGEGDPVAVSFFGDGATEEGVFFESLNFAALKKLPVLFVCENNGWAVHSRQSERQSVSNIAEKVSRFGIPADILDGRDLPTIYQKTSNVIETMRSGHYGPHFFECHTSRWREHVGPNADFHSGYRSEEEIAPWIENDPVKIFRNSMNEAEAKEIEEEVEIEIREAFDEAEQSPVPEDDELFTDVLEDR